MNENQRHDKQLEESTITMPEFMEIVEECIFDWKAAAKARDLNHTGTPGIYIRSVPGIGKSQRIKGFAKKYNLPVRVIDCNHLQQGDLSGIPVQVQDSKGNTHIEKLTVNNMFPEPIVNGKENPEYWGAGIVFFDELSSCPMDVRTELLTYCDGSHKEGMDGKDYSVIPPFWLILAAGNNGEYVGDNFIELPYSLRSRFDTYDVIPEIEDFRHYMSSLKDDTYGVTGFHPMVIAYLSIKANKGDLAPKPDFINADNCANPRNWRVISDNLRNLDNMVKSNQVPKKEISRRVERRAYARLGAEVAKKFCLFYDNEKDMIGAEELWKAPLTTKNADYRKKSIDIKMLSIYRAIDDYTNTVLERKNDAKVQANKKTGYLNILDNAEFLFHDQPEEYVESIFTDVLAKDTGITSSKDLSPKFKDIAIKSQIFNS